MRFSSSSYATIYKSKGDLGEYNPTKSACFRNIFSRLEQNNNKIVTQEYKIYIAKDYGFLEEYYSNYCLVSERTVNRYLRALQLLIPKIKWEILEEKYSKYNTFAINITVTATGFQHRFLLTYIRYLYEYPYNVLLADAYKLKDLPEYRFDSINNLYHLCVISFPGWYGTGHALLENPKYCSNKKLIEILNSKRRTSLNGILKSTSLRYRQLPSNVDIKEVDYWTSEEEFRKRLKIYNENYKEWIKESM